MMWVRSNIRHGARLALFALLVQLVLTLGHSHGFVEAAPLVKSSQQQLQADGHKPSEVDRVSVDKRSPANPYREYPGDDHCAICAVVAMAGTVVFATSPLLLEPQAVEFLYRTADAEFIHLESVGLPFQPRAPPAS